MLGTWSNNNDDDDDDGDDDGDDDDDDDDDDGDEKVIQKLKAFLLTDHCMILMVRWPTKANQKKPSNCLVVKIWYKYHTDTHEHYTNKNLSQYKYNRNVKQIQ